MRCAFSAFVNRSYPAYPVSARSTLSSFAFESSCSTHESRGVTHAALENLRFLPLYSHIISAAEDTVTGYVLWFIVWPFENAVTSNCVFWASFKSCDSFENSSGTVRRVIEFGSSSISSVNVAVIFGITASRRTETYLSSPFVMVHVAKSSWSTSLSCTRIGTRGSAIEQETSTVAWQSVRQFDGVSFDSHTKFPQQLGTSSTTQLPAVHVCILHVPGVPEQKGCGPLSGVCVHSKCVWLEHASCVHATPSSHEVGQDLYNLSSCVQPAMRRRENIMIMAFVSMYSLLKKRLRTNVFFSVAVPTPKRQCRLPYPFFCVCAQPSLPGLRMRQHVQGFLGRLQFFVSLLLKALQA